MQQEGRGAQIHQEGVHLAVVVVIGEAAPRPTLFTSKNGPAARDTSSNFPPPRLRKSECSCGTRWIRPPWTMKISSQAVVVEIVGAGAPTDVLRGQLRDAGVLGDVLELQLARRSSSGGCTWNRRPTGRRGRRCRGRRNTGPMAEVFSPFCP